MENLTLLFSMNAVTGIHADRAFFTGCCPDAEYTLFCKTAIRQLFWGSRDRLDAACERLRLEET